MNQHLSRRRTLLMLAAAPMAPVLAACGGGGAGDTPGTPPAEPLFVSEGLAGRIVHRLRPSAGGGLLAATDKGLYQRITNGNWEARGLAAEHVFDVTAVTPSHWLASVSSTSGGAGASPRLVETTNAGLAWQPVANDFGGVGGPEAIQALMADTAGGRLLATGTDVLAQSRDLGRTWERLAGQYHAFANPKTALAFDPQLGDVWYGGQDAIERLVLFRWKKADGGLIEHPDLMSAPSVVKGIRFAQGQPERVLVAGEGGLVHSLDRGGSWQSLLADGHHFYFDVVQDPQRPQRWVTARWQKNFDDPQRMLVKVTDDDGRTWRDLWHGDPQLFGGVWSLAAYVEGERTVFQFGLYKGGMMRLELP